MAFNIRSLVKPIRVMVRSFTMDNGNIKDAGGKWAERETAFENQYFNKKVKNTR